MNYVMLIQRPDGTLTMAMTTNPYEAHKYQCQPGEIVAVVKAESWAASHNHEVPR